MPASEKIYVAVHLCYYLLSEVVAFRPPPQLFFINRGGCTTGGPAIVNRDGLPARPPPRAFLKVTVNIFLVVQAQLWEPATIHRSPPCSAMRELPCPATESRTAGRGTTM